MEIGDRMNDRDEQIARVVDSALSDEPESFRRRFVAVLSELSADDWAVLARYAQGLVDKREEE